MKQSMYSNDIKNDKSRLFYLEVMLRGKSCLTNKQLLLQLKLLSNQFGPDSEKKLVLIIVNIKNKNTRTP